MTKEYLSPGVYIEEVDKGPKPIEGVSTSTAAFIGFTEKVPEITVRRNGKYEGQKAIGQPRLITNWTQYKEQFGGFVEGAYLPYSVYGFFENGGQRCYVISLQEVPKMPKAQQKLLGGQMVVEAKQSGVEGTRLRFRVDFAGADLKKLPEPAAEAGKEEAPGAKEAGKETAKEGKTAPKDVPLEPSSFSVYVERLDDDAKWKPLDRLDGLTIIEEKSEDGTRRVPKVKYKYDKASEWVDILLPKSRPALMELYNKKETQDWQYLEFEKSQLPGPDVEKIGAQEEGKPNMGGILETLDDVSILCVPDLMVPKAGQDEPDRITIKAVHDMMVSHCEKMGDRVAILDTPPNLTPQEVKEWSLRLPDTSYAALYYPWIEIKDPVQKRVLAIPPSGHMAGIWARSDNSRGVHKAPANEDIRNAIGLSYSVTKGEQDTLNPIGVNCLREFPGRGIRVWGARTISSNPSWRYLNVRRLFNYVEKSIERSTQWVVFEPNDHDLWARITRDVRSFLKIVWRAGALFGLTEEQAFYVKCDEELNPPESRDLGRLIVEIGMAPVKPAEFVIFRITQTGGIGSE